MRLAGILVLFTCGAAVAQSIISESQVPVVMKAMQGRYDEPQLDCSVSALRPTLNFSFRMQAGYVVRVPMNQYLGPGHIWVMLSEITPEAGDRRPVYLGAKVRLPDVPKTKAEVEVGGGYLLGEGRYRVRFLLYDDAGRICRKQWNTEVRLSHGERHVKVAMAPHSVAAFSLLGRGDSARVRDDKAPLRITILMHAAPLTPRRTRMRASDRMLLLGSLSALLERLPTRWVRLVLFNLDQQRELYRQEDFTPEKLEQVSTTMNELELGLVDYHVLQNSRGHVDLLADLVNQESRAEHPADVVVFLGPATRFGDKIPRESLDAPTGNAPRFFYFQYKPVFRREGPTLPDTINLTVGNLKGKTIQIHTPNEFARAIERLER